MVFLTLVLGFLHSVTYVLSHYIMQHYEILASTSSARLSYWFTALLSLQNSLMIFPLAILSATFVISSINSARLLHLFRFHNCRNFIKKINCIYLCFNTYIPKNHIVIFYRYFLLHVGNTNF